MELLFWTISLLMLFVLNPNNEFTLCILHNLGFNHCFGCGLGKSIHYFLHLNIQESINFHWFGPFSVMIIVIRILKLFKNKYIGVKQYG